MELFREGRRKPAICQEPGWPHICILASSFTSQVLYSGTRETLVSGSMTNETKQHIIKFGNPIFWQERFLQRKRKSLGTNPPHC
jgi:hypothetical protein